MSRGTHSRTTSTPIAKLTPLLRAPCPLNGSLSSAFWRAECPAGRHDVPQAGTSGVTHAQHVPFM